MTRAIFSRSICSIHIKPLNLGAKELFISHSLSSRRYSPNSRNWLTSSTRTSIMTESGLKEPSLSVPANSPTTSEQRGAPRPKDKTKGQSTTRPKGQFTHFLCLPLVTPVSASQLQSSIAKFKDLIPLLPPNANTEGKEQASKDPNPLIPYEAIRPLGTLHLTLGMMTLIEGRLKEALDFLQSLDLEAILRNVQVRKTEEHVDGSSTSAATSSSQPITDQPIPPLNISLSSIGVLPSPKAASIIYMRPKDPTSRLHEFCQSLLQKFIDAGFVDPPPSKRKELLLHATVANTIYVRRPRKRGKAAHGQKSGGAKRNWNDGKIDLREFVKNFEAASKNTAKEGSEDQSFVWAQDVIIDKVKICEMGAKHVEDEVLGQEYRVVGEKRILQQRTKA